MSLTTSSKAWCQTAASGDNSESGNQTRTNYTISRLPERIGRIHTSRSSIMVFSRLASPKSVPNQPDSRREVRIVRKKCRTSENSLASHFGKGTDLNQLEKTIAITILASLTVETCWDLRAQHGLLICQLYRMFRILVGFISASLSQDPRLPSSMRSTSLSHGAPGLHCQ